MKSISECSTDDLKRFPCPECGGGCRVLETRMTFANGKARRRRYACVKCGKRFSTLEKMIEQNENKEN